MSSLTVSFERQLEPNVLTRMGGDPVSLSQAISLKRQADASQRIATALETLAGELAHPEWGVVPAIREAARK